MVRTRWMVGAIAMLSATASIHAGGWVDFQETTGQRLVSAVEVGRLDVEEKDYAWGDVDKDGDIDLVVVRKHPFTSAGGKRNVLFMNEGLAEGHALNGVLVDRTAQYATAADDGGQGFLDLTNDRDVVLVDVDGDTWLDIVTATTISDGLPKTISHPRVYVNLGESAGVWQGFEYQEARTPQIYTMPGPPTGMAVAPRFCSIDAGDVTGDGAPDLYFGDYDSSGAGGVPPPPGIDVNDRLWINDGNGFFTDSYETRMTNEMLFSKFGTAVALRDMNNDGTLDVCKDTGLQDPRRISVSYNDPGNLGYFPAGNFDVVYQLSAYFISVDDLNGDGRLDMIVVDDGTDRYMLNQGNGPDGFADFLTLTMPSGSNGFGGNSFIADLNNDGHKDVIITDVDVDIPGCERRMHIYRNLGNTPNVSFQEQGEVIPIGFLNGTHDVAVFDINNDGWLDLVVGRCETTEIWMNQPPIGIVFAYPDGIPPFIDPDQTRTVRVDVNAYGGGTPVPGSGRIFMSVDGGPFTETPMTVVGVDQYEATLPALPCTGQARYYFSADLDGGGTYTDPSGAPDATFQTIAASGSEITLRDELEGDVSGWMIENDPSLSSGAWEHADPVGTFSSGQAAAPENDATQGVENILAFITGNGDPDCQTNCEFAADVDGGPTRLISPLIDLEGTDATISFARWFVSDLGAIDEMTVEVSNDDGASWTLVDSMTTTGTNSSWQTVAFVLGDWVTPTSTVRVRFATMDVPNDSVTEAGVDNFQVERFICPGACPADLDGSGDVGFGDILEAIGAWGPCPGCPQDVDGSGDVGFGDILAIIGAWGPCL